MIDFRIKPEGFSQGFYEMPFERYVEIQALNSSKQKRMDRTPAHFKAFCEAPEINMTSAKRRQLNIGKLFDEFVINKSANYAIEPDLNKNSKAYGAWKRKAAGKTTISSKDLNLIRNMIDFSFQKEKFKKIFNTGIGHRIMIWKCLETGLWCKAELDWLDTSDDGCLVDLKTTVSVDYWAFMRNAVKRFQYVNQLAHYIDGLNTITGKLHRKAKIVAVETVPPHECHVFNVPWHMLDDAHWDNIERRQAILDCLEADHWPGYPDMEIDLDSGNFIDPFLEGETGHAGF